eukprot:s6_g28.t1
MAEFRRDLSSGQLHAGFLSAAIYESLVEVETSRELRRLQEMSSRRTVDSWGETEGKETSDKEKGLGEMGGGSSRDRVGRLMAVTEQFGCYRPGKARGSWWLWKSFICLSADFGAESSCQDVTLLLPVARCHSNTFEAWVREADASGERQIPESPRWTWKTLRVTSDMDCRGGGDSDCSNAHRSQVEMEIKQKSELRATAEAMTLLLKSILKGHVDLYDLRKKHRFQRTAAQGESERSIQETWGPCGQFPPGFLEECNHVWQTIGPHSKLPSILELTFGLATAVPPIPPREGPTLLISPYLMWWEPRPARQCGQRPPHQIGWKTLHIAQPGHFLPVAFFWGGG